MWKGFYDKLQEIKENPVTEHEAKYVIIIYFILFILLIFYITLP